MRKSLFLLAFVAALFSCKKQENVPPPSPSDLSGSIIGRWKLVKIVVKNVGSLRDYVDSANSIFCTVTPLNDSTKYSVTINNINAPNLFCEFTNIDAGGDATGYKIGTNINIVISPAYISLFDANPAITNYTFNYSEINNTSSFNPNCDTRIYVYLPLTVSGTYYRIASDNSYIDVCGATSTIIKLTSTELVIQPSTYSYGPPYDNYNYTYYFTKISK